MTHQRDFFTELTEGLDALKSEREGKLTLRIFKAESKSAPVLSPQDVIHMREQLHMSRPVFAHYLRTNFCPGVVIGSCDRALGHARDPVATPCVDAAGNCASRQTGR